MGHFEDDLAWSQTLQPEADQLYRNLFGSRTEVVRLDGTPADKTLGIDVCLRVRPGPQMVMRSLAIGHDASADYEELTVQEKFLRHEHLRRYGNFMLNTRKAVGTRHEAVSDKGYLRASYLLWGWANEMSDGFSQWVLVNVASLRLWTAALGTGLLFDRLRKNKVHCLKEALSCPVYRLLDCSEACSFSWDRCWYDDSSQTLRERHRRWLDECWLDDSVNKELLRKLTRRSS